MNLYYGDNGQHEFWENEGRTFLIIRNHGHQSWLAVLVAGSYEGFGIAKRPQTIANRIQRHYGIVFSFNKSKQWIQQRKNARKMKLVLRKEHHQR